MTEQILAVQRMQEYIDAHLEEEITLSDLAQVSLFSPWHAYRLFRQHTGLTPADYIRRLRLSRSAVRLKRDGCRVTDAAHGAKSFRAPPFFIPLRFRRKMPCYRGRPDPPASVCPRARCRRWRAP